MKKILGITINFKLKCNSHVSELCRKDARQINAANFIKANTDEEIRMEIYMSFILSNFNYCTLGWHFVGLKYEKMEKVQKRAMICI